MARLLKSGRCGKEYWLNDERFGGYRRHPPESGSLPPYSFRGSQLPAGSLEPFRRRHPVLADSPVRGRHPKPFTEAVLDGQFAPVQFGSLRGAS